MLISDTTAEQSHWSERGRATSVANADALGRPRRSVLSFGKITFFSSTMSRELLLVYATISSTIVAGGLLRCRFSCLSFPSPAEGLSIRHI